MAKINLLPPESANAERRITFSSFSFSVQALCKIVLFLNIIFLSGGIGLRIITWQRSQGLTVIDGEYQQADAANKKAHTAKQEYEKAAKELASLNAYIERELLWSEKLTQLSKLIPEEAWLTNFTLRKKSSKDTDKRALYLKGALRPPKDSTHIIELSKFINQLKEDAAFSAQFDSPVLTESKAELRDNTEIMTFAIEMPFKKDTAH